MLDSWLTRWRETWDLSRQRGFEIESLKTELNSLRADIAARQEEKETQLLIQDEYSQMLRAMARRSVENRSRWLDLAQDLGCGRVGTHEWFRASARNARAAAAAAHERFVARLDASGIIRGQKGGDPW